MIVLDFVFATGRHSKPEGGVDAGKLQVHGVKDYGSQHLGLASVSYLLCSADQLPTELKFIQNEYDFAAGST
jgi:hypothetical protein